MGASVSCSGLHWRFLSTAQMFRVSYLLGIFKPLNILHGEKIAE
jgi:hypothetical protein